MEEFKPGEHHDEFKPGEYHPAFHKPPVHDHHRRARHAFFSGLSLVPLGGLLLFWSTRRYWGDKQVVLARVGGWAFLAIGCALLAFAGYAYFSFDDDQHPELPE